MSFVEHTCDSLYAGAESFSSHLRRAPSRARIGRRRDVLVSCFESYSLHFDFAGKHGGLWSKGLMLHDASPCVKVETQHLAIRFG